MPSELKSIKGKSLESIVDDLVQTSKTYTPLQVDLSKILLDKKGLSKDQRKAQRKLERQKVHEMNLLWLKKMVEDKAVLREKMSFFFHDHFAVRMNNPHANLHLNNIIREHATGNFGTLLMEVSKSPAMIAFLNNKQNVKSHPNENFAREVMELFTLGRDNGYTEKDIQEAARAFTGWTFDKTGAFRFAAKKHDTGEKTILGQTGNFKGKDVIRILLEQKQTARYLTEKLVHFFIGRPISESKIEEFTSVFYDSNYELEQLIRAIFLSDEFMDEETIGCKIKSPTEFIVGITKLFKIDYQEPKRVIQVQNKLNQELFFPPNVAGWQTGTGWIDSSTLTLRMKLPSILLNFGVIEWYDVEHPEEVNAQVKKKIERIKSKNEKRFKAYPDWKFFSAEIEGQKERLASFLIQPELSSAAQRSLTGIENRELKDQVIQILSLPEYQLF